MSEKCYIAVESLQNVEKTWKEGGDYTGERGEFIRHAKTRQFANNVREVLFWIIRDVLNRILRYTNDSYDLRN